MTALIVSEIATHPDLPDLPRPPTPFSLPNNVPKARKLSAIG